MELPNGIVQWLEKIPMPKAVRNTFDVGLETVLEFYRDDVPRMGAALAYYTLFSLFPLLLLLISLGGYLLKAGVSLVAQAEGQILEALSLTLPQAGHFLNEVLQTAESRSGEVGLVGTVILLWAAANVFAQLDRTFQVIWDVQDPPPFWRFPHGVCDLLAPLGGHDGDCGLGRCPAIDSDSLFQGILVEIDDLGRLVPARCGGLCRPVPLSSTGYGPVARRLAGCAVGCSGLGSTKVGVRLVRQPGRLRGHLRFGGQCHRLAHLGLPLQPGAVPGR